jgi:hypothetical protein
LGKSRRKLGPGDIQRFDQKNNIQSRMTWDLLEIGKTHYVCISIGTCPVIL